MSQNLRVSLNSSSIRAFLKSPVVAGEVEKYAKTTASRAGQGYESDVFVGRDRVMASAYTDTFEAMRDNAKNQTLLRVFGGGR